MSNQDILVLAETNRGQLAEMSLEMLGAARQLATGTGGKVIAVLPLLQNIRPGPDGLVADLGRVTAHLVQICLGRNAKGAKRDLL